MRYGVAPDHEKIRNVTRTFEKAAARPGFRFFGAVEVGRQVSLDDLRRHYHQVCFTTGAQTDRRMGIPGEDLAGSHAATEFVAWYNGHPDYRDRTFDFSQERVAVVGVGNVAVDVARILCRTVDELATTDIADYALAALGASRVREVHMLGRRGPLQAAFTNAELRELGELEAADVAVRPEEVALDPLSGEDLERGSDRATGKKLEILQEFAERPRVGKPRLLSIRFLVSPCEMTDDGSGRVQGLRLVRNRLVRGPDGTLKAVATDEQEHLPVGLVFRSVGYRGVPIEGIPFDERRGTVPNEGGRIVDPERGRLVGLYVAGWIKRGPSGIIGTNKPDATETAAAMREDATAGAILSPAEPDPAAAVACVGRRAGDYVSYQDWLRIDAAETERGAAVGRPRVKLTTVAEMRAARGREQA